MTFDRCQMTQGSELAAADATAASLKSYRRIIIKIGSALLVDRATGLKRDMARHRWPTTSPRSRAGGAEVLVVSSGAIALGRRMLALGNRALKLEESQAAAAVGQIALAGAWSEASAGTYRSRPDPADARRYRGAPPLPQCARHHLDAARDKAVPVINENDTVATTEIRYGDNDRLAARVATMMGADLLVLLSDIDGLYTAPPALDPKARFIPVVDRITPEIEAMAGAAASELSRGGMRTKIDAGKIATPAGTAMIIASGKAAQPAAWRSSAASVPPCSAERRRR